MRALIVLCALAVAGTVLAAAPAIAELGGSDTRSCVTEREHRAVKIGMSKSRVHRIFDGKGQFSSRNDGYEFRTYRPCEGFLDYSLRYLDGKLDAKL